MSEKIMTCFAVDPKPMISFKLPWIFIGQTIKMLTCCQPLHCGQLGLSLKTVQLRYIRLFCWL